MGANFSLLDTAIGDRVLNASAISAILGAVPAQRFLPLTDVKTDTGLPMITATAATTLPGIVRSAGSDLYLRGVVTSGAQTVSTNMFWEFDLPQSYVAGNAIPIDVNCVVATATDVTASTTTMTVAAYSESVAGVETALSVSAAQEIPLTTAATLAFSLAGTGLKPGQRVAIELTMAVTTTSGGASFGQVNSISFTA